MAKKKLKKTPTPLKPKKIGIEIIDIDEPLISDEVIGKFYKGLADEISTKKNPSKKRGRPSKFIAPKEETKISMEKTAETMPEITTSKKSIESEKITHPQHSIDIETDCKALLLYLEIPSYHWIEFLFDVGVYFKNQCFRSVEMDFGSIFAHKYFKHKKEKE